VSLFVVLLLPALIIAAGLVLDGGRQLQTRRDADGAAAAAARAAVQLTQAETRGHQLDPALAAERAQGALASMGYSGSVSVDGDSVTVVVTAEVTNLILPGAHTVTGSATVVPQRGVLTGG
jgi:Flp pilus assembly protein TadG